MSRVERRGALVARRAPAARTGSGVAGAAEGFGAAGTRILAGGLGQVQALVADQASGVEAKTPVAGRRLGEARERMPVKLIFNTCDPDAGGKSLILLNLGEDFAKM
jgi:hypothetical protein